MQVKENKTALLFLALTSMMTFISLALAFPTQENTQDGERYSFEPANHLSKSGDVSMEYAGSKYKSSIVTKRDGRSDVNANKRNPAVAAGAKALVSNPKVQEAAVEKGIEIAGKLVDKKLKIIEDAQKKASDFLKEKIQIDITPDKGWQNEDMFLPSGYHIDATVSGGEKSPDQKGSVPYVFPSGLGGVLMNGCWGTGYKVNDPCYHSKRTSTICSNMIDGAAFLGVGFDGRGKYSPDSRKMSIVQRNCANKATYGGEDVPDSMNVHGIYDTTATLVTFESREEYSKFLQREAGISGSYFGFSAGVKAAWGESTQTARQKYLAVMDVDVNRYEIFMDEVKPKDLSLSFLREFMDLPLSYFSAGGPLLYQNFIQRWGTHYIKSAKFGGQLEIRKTMDAKDAKGRKEFEIQMELEYKTLFASVGAKAAAQENESKRNQTKTTSTSIVAHGGSQDIASILSDVYSPTFKTEFKEWLKTIPAYPKAFRFQMGSITDLLNFRANDLFPDEKVTWGCEGNVLKMKTEMKDGKELKYYEVVAENNKNLKYYCEFDSRWALENAIQRRRTSLLRAMEIYMEEGPTSISDTQLKACKRKSNKQSNDEQDGLISWKQVIENNTVLNISFDMLEDLPSSIRGALDIGRNTSRLVRFHNKRWRTSDQDGNFHLYGAFNNGDSKDIFRQKISIFGLILTFNEAEGTLTLSPEDYKASKKFFPTLEEQMTGVEFARLEVLNKETVKRDSPPAVVSLKPCKVYWSNALRFDPTDAKGKCLHFTASAEGSIFLVFAALPKNDATWYYVEINSARVAIYKGTTLKTKTTNMNARALGDATLYQSYFVCVTEAENSTVIEYGKSLGTSDSGDVYLNLIDSVNHLNVRFYAFGNDEKPAKIMDAHIVPRSLTEADCKGDTVRERGLDMCVQKCHMFCDPLAGCKNKDSAKVPDGCYACRFAMDAKTKTCIARCPRYKTLTREKLCVPTFDVSLKASANFGPLEISDIPTLKEFTICLWLKFEGTWTKKTSQGFHLVRYFKDAHEELEAFLTYPPNKPAKIELQLSVRDSGSLRVYLSDMENGKWNQLCISWSGYEGVAVFYKNGQRVSSASYPEGEIRGGGTLMLGGKYGSGDGQAAVTLHISQFNLWDKVLTNQDIRRNAAKCDSGEGNAKGWHEWYNIAKAKQGFLRDPSFCRPGR